MRSIVLLDAPSNLGLRPPAPGTVPGCYKLAGALRDQDLARRLGATEGGVVVPPRYDRGDWAPGDGVFNAAALAGYTRRLADRLEQRLAGGAFPVVLGGDCSILLGSALALRRRGRYGLAFLDGHSDFRHVGNSPHVGAAAGEDLALVTGRGQPDLVDLDGLAPYVRDSDVRMLGVRDADEARAELTGLGIACTTVAGVRRDGAAAVAGAARTALESAQLEGFWVHVDADVLDPAVLAAVDSPDPGGLTVAELGEALATLVASPRCVGVQLTVYDPDLDPDLDGARLLADVLERVLSG